MIFSSSPRVPRSPFFRGFSLIEVIVATSILVMIMTSVLVNYGSIGARVNLDSDAEGLGQWVLDAQTSAMSARPTKADATKFYGYGLHVVSGSNQVIYFSDVNNNQVYDAGTDWNENTITLLHGSTVTSICGDSAGGTAAAPCITPPNKSSIVDVTYKRPDPDAVIKGDWNGAGFPKRYTRIQITVSSRTGYARAVEVWETGQVSIK